MQYTLLNHQRMIIFLLTLIPYLCTCTQPDDVVEIAQGRVRGLRQVSRNGNDFVSFNGIPYGAPPIGEYRFQPAQPAGGWNGTLDALVWPPYCVQFPGRGDDDDPVQVQGQEDCLYLSVDTSDTQPQVLKPVMFWIHGGGFNTGSGNAMPHYLIDEDIVLVRINYRLGPLGFLSLGTPRVSGNQGIRDMILALHWVQANIEMFGGDPGKVTIFGESAGGWAVFNLMVSPEASGLFRAVISESQGIIGLNNQFFYSPEQATASGLQTASLAGCQEDLESCLENSSLSNIVAAGTSPQRMKGGYPRANQDDFSMHGSLFPDFPENIVEFGLHNKVPVMAGTNTAEGTMFAGDIFWNPDLMERLNDEGVWEAEGPYRVMFRTPALAGSDWEPCDSFIAEEAKQFYFNGTFAASKLQNYVDMISDSSIIRATHKTLMVLANSNSMEGQKVYEYVLSFQDETSQTYDPRAYELGVGVPHVNDVFYLFYVPGAESWSPRNLLISQQMCAMWANFAKEMNPTPPHGDNHDSLGDFVWTDIVGGGGMMLDIGEELKMDYSPNLHNRMEFWARTEKACQVASN